MGISATVPYGLADFSVNSLKANNVSIVPGVVNYDSASSTALTISANDIGLTAIQGLMIGCGDMPFKVQRVSDAEWTMEPIAAAVGSVSTSVNVIMPTASMVIASQTGIPFLAWGYRR